MKKYIPYLIALSFCLSSHAENVYVGADGKYYTTVDGTTETSLSSTSIVGFQTGVTTWTLTDATTIASIDGATAKGVSINVGSNVLKFESHAINDGNANTSVTFTGTKGVVFAGGTGNNTKGFSNNTNAQADSGDIPTIHYNIIDSTTTSSEFNGSFNANFIIGENAIYNNNRFSTATSTIRLTLKKNATYLSSGNQRNANWAKVIFKGDEGSLVDVKTTGIYMNIVGDSYLDGTIIARGGRSDGHTFTLTANTATFTFMSNAKVFQTSKDAVKNPLLSGTIVSNAATGSLIFAKDITINNDTKLTLNTSNAFVGSVGTFDVEQGSNGQYQAVNVTKTQGDTIFYLAAAKKLTLILGAQQDFGGFYFNSGATINISLNGNAIDLGALTGTLANNSIVIEDFANYLVSASEEFSTEYVKAYAMIDGSKQELTDLRWINENGISYLYSGALVPEPAEWAMIFGAIALAFVAYRRRR